MSNLPKQLPSIKAFDQSPLTIRLDMYSGFVAPDTITFEVWWKGAKRYDVTGVYNSGDNRITADFTALQIQEMPLIADCRIRFGVDQYPFRVQIKPTSDGTADGVVGYTITQDGDSYTVVEIVALDLVTEQAGIATDKAQEALSSATTATNGASIASQKATEAASARDEVVIINEGFSQIDSFLMNINSLV